MQNVEAMRKLFAMTGKGGMAAFELVHYTFARMEDAERLIKEAQQKYPDKTDLLHGAFVIAAPPELLRRYEPFVYEAHFGELLERVAAGHDTRPGTCAEVVAGLLGASLIAPLNEQSLHVLNYCFEHAFPQHWHHFKDVWFTRRERWEGQLQEDLTRCRKVCRNDDRRYP